MNTETSISQIIKRSICSDDLTFTKYQKRLLEGRPTRDENPKSHFCTYFLPYNSKNERIFIIHHKKSGLWISPGGHIDKEENLREAVNREISEELGVKDFFKSEPKPFLLTITPIENEKHPCKEHFDIWYLVPTDGSNFDVDPREFHNSKWLTVEEAQEIVTDENNILALNKIKDNKS